MLSVQRTLAGTQSTFFRATLRLKICVSSKVSLASWQSSFATDRPTVPKPAIATFNFFRRITGFFAGADWPRDLDFARFAFAANASPRRESRVFQSAWIIRYFQVGR